MINMEEKPETQPLLTPEQVAAYLNTETYNVNRWIRQGLLPGIKVGREWRVRPTDLEKFIHNNTWPKKENSR